MRRNERTVEAGLHNRRLFIIDIKMRHLLLLRRPPLHLTYMLPIVVIDELNIPVFKWLQVSFLVLSHHMSNCDDNNYSTLSIDNYDCISEETVAPSRDF